MKRTSLISILLVMTILLGATQMQMISSGMDQPLTPHAPKIQILFSGYDSENISVVLIQVEQTGLGNTSLISGTVDLNMTVTSDNTPLNLTLFVEDEIHPDYNVTEVMDGNQNFTINTTILPEGFLNFTFLFEENNTGILERETYYLVFEVDNHGYPGIEIIAPSENANFTGLDDIYLNITSDYAELFLNITVDGTLTEEYNATVVPVGANNYTINGSRYENGNHNVTTIVYTEEGLVDSAWVELFFIDHIRFTVVGVANYQRVSGNASFIIRTTTPYSSGEMSVYIDDELTSDAQNITIYPGRTTIFVETSPYSEGEHNFTFIANDDFGHDWKYTLLLIVDNHGVPEASFISPDSDVVVGIADFTITIESTWETVQITVYVDDEIVSGLEDITANVGTFSFSFDTNNYTKWEHELKVVITTAEGETTEITRTFGFANFKIEEIASLVILLGVSIFIPLYRKVKGQPIKEVVIADLLYAIIIAVVFVFLGVNTIALLVWHTNLASIWIFGSILIFVNWVIPLLYMSEQ